MKKLLSLLCLVVVGPAAYAFDIDYINAYPDLDHPPTCVATTPNLRPPKCVDYNHVFKRPPLCSAANPLVLPPACSLIDEPSHVLTPGSVFATPQLADICNVGYEATVPLPTTLSSDVKQQLYVSYVFPYQKNTGPCTGGCVIDNLIPIGLGGDNTLANIWPQPLTGTWNATMKNTLETTLRSRVCTVTPPHTSSVPISVARDAIASDWKSAYTKYVTNQE